MHRISHKLVAIVAASALVLSACGEVSQLLDLPRLEAEDLQQRVTPQTSRIYDSEGRLITTFHGAKDRTIVRLERLPDHMIDAVLAIEDERFFSHEGLDLRGIARAAFRNLQRGEAVQGGSTITQQYVKQRIIAEGDARAEKSLARKVREAALARQLEAELSKEEILERYLNTVYLGNGAYGVQAAAKTYFDKDIDDVSLREGALLAGLIAAPSRFDPYDGRKRARRRRARVLERMVEAGFLGGERADKVTERPLNLVKKPQRRRHRGAYFVDYVKRMLVFHPRFDFLGNTPAERSETLYTGGLRIYTTLDSRMQRIAERVVQRTLHEKGDPSGSLVAIRPGNGHIKVMVGGKNFFAKEKKGFSKLNLAITSRPNLGSSNGESRAPGTGRQAGSAFKPFAFAAALQRGMSPLRDLPGAKCREYEDHRIDDEWRVCNYGNASYGRIPATEALIKSVNVAFAQLILDVGPKRVTDLARKMGLRTDLSPVPSAVLGTNPVNPLGMASAFATFAANGKWQRPIAVKRIEDHTGEVIYSRKKRGRRALKAATAYLTTQVMRDVIQRGTGTAARLDRPAAGKTGTAQEYRDAWFAGFTPQLSAAVWVGYPPASIEMRTSCGTQNRMKCRPTRINVTGGSWPAQMWRAFMTRALRDEPVRRFKEPKGGLVEVEIDTRNGCRATRWTPSDARETVTIVRGTVRNDGSRRCRRARREDRREEQRSQEQRQEEQEQAAREDESEGRESSGNSSGGGGSGGSGDSGGGTGGGGDGRNEDDAPSPEPAPTPSATDPDDEIPEGEEQANEGEEEAQPSPSPTG